LDVREKGMVKKLALLIIVLLLVGALPKLALPQEWVLYGLLFFVYLAMANMWNLLCGYSGLISLCQPAFVGIAGYTLVILVWIGVPYYLAIVAGGIIAGLFAIFTSIPVFRLSGIYFAIGTLVVPEALRILFLLWRPVGGKLSGGGAGYMLRGMEGVSVAHYYWIACVVGIGSILLMRGILRSKLGLGLAAIRDNDRSAASSGMNVFKLKLYSFVIAAFVTGIAGAIFYLYQGYVEPGGAFSIQWTMLPILATVIGGIATETGPIVGTVVVVFLDFLLARYAGFSMLIQGAILVGIMLLAPQGFVQIVRQVGNRWSRPRTTGVQTSQ
jgi:branched-chain amino acid transport system permease protein